MERLFQTIPMDEEQQRLHQQRVDRLLADKKVRQLMERKKLNPEQIAMQPGRIEAWVQKIHLCDGCRSIQECRQKIHGRVPELVSEEDGLLDSRWIPCLYEKDELKEVGHASKFLIRHMPDQDLRIDLADEIEQRQVVEKSDKMIPVLLEIMNSAENNAGFFLYGQPGTGKSYTLSGLANEAARMKRSVAYVRVPQLINELKELFYNPELRQKLLGNLRRADVLILDDFGSESITPWSRDEILFPLLDERMSKRKKTCFASNSTPEELEAIYAADGRPGSKVAAQRLMSRVLSLAKPVPLIRRSLRSRISA